MRQRPLTGNKIGESMRLNYDYPRSLACCASTEPQSFAGLSRGSSRLSGLGRRRFECYRVILTEERESNERAFSLNGPSTDNEFLNPREGGNYLLKVLPAEQAVLIRVFGISE